MNKRCIALLLAMVLCFGLLTGCGGSGNGGQTQTPESVAPSTKLSKPPAEDQIIYDINSFGVEAMEINNAVATSCEIIKRQTNEENKEDIAYVRIVCEGEYNRFEYQFRLLYIFYDVGGWILEDVSYENTDEWTETYIAADGGDLMDTIIWLDESFTPDMFILDGYGRGYYWGEIDNTHYIGIQYNKNVYGDFEIYDQDGNHLTSCNGDYFQFNRSHFERVFVNEYGEVRFVISDRDENDNPYQYLSDEYGNCLSDNYSSIIPMDFDKFNGVCFTWDRQTELYGAIDRDGNVLREQTYADTNDILVELGIPPEEYDSSASTDEEWETIYEKDVKGADGDWETQYYYEDGTPFELLMQEDSTLDTRQYLVRIEDGLSFRYYDAGGNPRSPWLMNLDDDYHISLVAYNGRCGILPRQSVASNKIELEHME